MEQQAWMERLLGDSRALITHSGMHQPCAAAAALCLVMARLKRWAREGRRRHHPLGHPPPLESRSSKAVGSSSETPLPPRTTGRCAWTPAGGKSTRSSSARCAPGLRTCPPRRCLLLMARLSCWGWCSCPLEPVHHPSKGFACSSARLEQEPPTHEVASGAPLAKGSSDRSPFCCCCDGAHPPGSGACVGWACWPGHPGSCCLHGNPKREQRRSS
mmetsp:Transcript_15836/g.44309  ORF Transcript_15836/g.44309 Transcript_15836/m.44309 type:complete len:215 (-) Transcript_15836:285-929(-)